MFTQEVRGLTLTSAVANTLFQNITGDKYGYDESFLATLRALTYDRVPKNESIQIRYTSSAFQKYELENTSPRDVIRAMLRRTGILDGFTHRIFVHSFESDDEANKTVMGIIDKNGIGCVAKEYEHVEKVSQYFSQKCRFEARVFVSEATKNAVVFVSHMTTKRWHCIQGMIPLYLPWYFADKPVTKEEQALLLTLQKRYEPEYRAAIEKIAEQFDFRSEALRQQLKGFETEFERAKLNDVIHQIEDKNNRIKNYEREIQNYYQAIQELNIKKVGLEVLIRDGGGEESNETLDFFLHSKNLDLVSCSNGKIEFIVKTTISNFDPDLYDHAIKNEDSSFYRDYWHGTPYPNKEFTKERTRKLMDALFRDEKLKLRVCAAYYLDFRRGNYDGYAHYEYPKNVLMDYMPNQHIDKFPCLGNNGPRIGESVRAHDFVGAIVMCISSAQNMNMSEMNTVSYFMQVIAGNNPGKIIELPDGTAVTPTDAIKWLEEQDGTKKQEQEEAKNE